MLMVLMMMAIASLRILCVEFCCVYLYYLFISGKYRDSWTDICREDFLNILESINRNIGCNGKDWFSKYR
jgi:hypothetical protein